MDESFPGNDIKIPESKLIYTSSEEEEKRQYNLWALVVQPKTASPFILIVIIYLFLDIYLIFIIYYIY